MYPCMIFWIPQKPMDDYTTKDYYRWNADEGEYMDSYFEADNFEDGYEDDYEDESFFDERDIFKDADLEYITEASK